MSYLNGKVVLVTGGLGFLGSYVVQKLHKYGCKSVATPTSEQCDLREKKQVITLIKEIRPEIVVHLAAKTGGIAKSLKNPATQFYDNAIMGMNIIDTSAKYNVGKCVIVSTTCVYPENLQMPITENDIWNGYPNQSNAAYGMAKRLLLAQAYAYRKQYNLNSIYLIPTNLYGPRDCFAIDNSHIIPSLIRQCLHAKEQGQESITIWGSGKASREFLYVEDCAKALIMAMEKYNKPDPVNIGSGCEISIFNLAKLIALHTGYTGKIMCDSSKPEGDLRRCISSEQAYREFGFLADTSLEQGIKNTINWYIRCKNK